MKTAVIILEFAFDSIRYVEVESDYSDYMSIERFNRAVNNPDGFDVIRNDCPDVAHYLIQLCGVKSEHYGNKRTLSGDPLLHEKGYTFQAVAPGYWRVYEDWQMIGSITDMTGM